MPVHNDMVSFPRVVRAALVMYETWREFAERVGAAKFGVDWLAAHCLIVLRDHNGTHMDSLRHMRYNAPGPEGIPLEYCMVTEYASSPLGVLGSACPVKWVNATAAPVRAVAIIEDWSPIEEAARSGPIKEAE
jgi:hypothetical protein